MAKNYTKTFDKTGTILDLISELENKFQKNNSVKNSVIKKNNFSQKFDIDLKDIKRYIAEMSDLANLIITDLNVLFEIIRKTSGNVVDVDIQNIYSSICDFAKDGKERYNLINVQTSALKKGMNTIIKDNKNGVKV